MSAPVVEAQGLTQVYEIRRGLFRAPARLQAVGGVSFAIPPGRTLAVVGESGCGKSTLARMVTLIEPPTAGTLRLDGLDAIDPAIEEAAENEIGNAPLVDAPLPPDGDDAGDVFDQAADDDLALDLLAVLVPEAAALVPQAQGNFKDGVYEGEAAGRNGQVKVSVKVEGGNIVALDVLESDETPMIFQGAWEHACEYIISNQNTDVDNVSGATISMAAIRNAVSNALEAAK